MPSRPDAAKEVSRDLAEPEQAPRRVLEYHVPSAVPRRPDGWISLAASLLILPAAILGLSAVLVFGVVAFAVGINHLVFTRGRSVLAWISLGMLVLYGSLVAFLVISGR